VAKQVTIGVTEHPNEPNAIEPAGRTKDITFPSEATILFRGLDIPAGSRFKANTFDVYALAAGKSVVLQGKEKSVTLVTTGQAIENGAIHDYSLSAISNGKETLILAPTDTDEAPTLIFAGDLNGDDYPDFVINISTHVSIQAPTLFLSGQNAQGDVVYTKTAERITYGC
jgi:hypothetical protein